jgi:mannose/cellobiose epimerase-like protein (N-acyl-D-glucosamine 2-epimerase family)
MATLKTIRNSLLALLLLLAAGQAAFVPTSVFFTQPDTGRHFVKASADFWKNYIDADSGGFYNNVDFEGNVFSTMKNMSPQSRLGYVFTRAFMVTGDTNYLTLAEHAVQFLYDHAWDNLSTQGGWNYSSFRGGYTGSSTSRWSYMQHYALLGPMALFEASGGQRFARPGATNHWDWIQKGVTFNNTYLWDPTTSREGYYQYYSLTSGGSGKGFTATVDAITTHAEELALITGESPYRQRLVRLGDAMAKHMVPAIDSPGVALGMPEEFNTNWSINRANTYAMVGHTVKTVWCLGRVNLVRPDTLYLKAAEKTFNHLWSQGFIDSENGGPYYEFTWSLPTFAANKKNYWMLEQGYNAGIMLSYLTKVDSIRDHALRMAEGSINFFFNHFAQSNGSAIMATDATGSIMVDDNVGDEWDAGYHATEFAWLNYLYGSLLYKRSPVTLYYRFNSSTTAQQIHLTPIMLTGDSLAIISVKKGTQTFANFNAQTRTISLAANEGGVFQVTFGYSSSGSAIQKADPKPNFSASYHQGSRLLQIDLPRSEILNIRSVDATGKTLAVWAKQGFNAGIHPLAVPASLPPGLSWVIVASQSHRMVLPVFLANP